jgi:integrase
MSPAPHLVRRRGEKLRFLVRRVSQLIAALSDLGICGEDPVPRVTAHGMRGLHGTLAVETGSSAHAVAAALGHESVTTTLQSYAKAGAGTSARQDKVLRVLSGGLREKDSAA